ncbi:glutamate-ammonia-ligase adenylyltransferase [Streptomyces sp. e14]|nr:glutamate-ammonia-ligase adenylyltransferase [Streptomyces sp. e14]
MCGPGGEERVNCWRVAWRRRPRLASRCVAWSCVAWRGVTPPRLAPPRPAPCRLACVAPPRPAPPRSASPASPRLAFAWDGGGGQGALWFFPGARCGPRRCVRGPGGRWAVPGAAVRSQSGYALARTTLIRREAGMTAPGRRSSTFTRLLRHGFTDASAAERLLESPELAPVRSDPVLLEALGGTADPDLALGGLVRLLEAQPSPTARRELLDTVIAAKPLRDRLLGVLGASAALGDHLARHPGDWHVLVTYEPRDLHPGVEEFERGLADADDPVSLRIAYRRSLLAIAARDVCGTTGVAETAAELADLATATLRAALRIASAAAPEDAERCRLAVIAMGKCGGHELNYVSDVDVIFVGEAVEGGDENAALRAATRLASHLMRICSETTVEGSIWPVDANLRPEGRNGPLVRTLSSHLAYYQRWAKTWEFQALLKARPVAGDAELGERYVDALAPLVWQAAERDNFVADVQKMRRRVVENIPVAEVERELKLGPGGLRDVEFAVQLLQLVHGRADASLRSGTTLDALQALAAGGYVGRADAVQLDEAYRFLRFVEHRIQLHQLRRTHLLPDDEAGLRRLGRSLGLRGDPAAELTREWKRHTSVVWLCTRSCSTGRC